MQKYIFSIIFCLAGFFSHAQDTLTSKKSGIHFAPLVCVYDFYPLQFGDHALHDAYTATPSVGITFSPARFGNFRLVAGYERSTYKVLKTNLIAEVEKSTLHNILFGVSYAIASQNGFSFSPTIGIGTGNLRLNTNSLRYGTNDQFNYRAGFLASYTVNKHMAIAFSAAYLHTNLDFDTSDAYRGYFSKSEQIQLGLGVQIF